MFKNLLKKFSRNQKYENICTLIDQCKLENNALIFFPKDNVLNISLIMDGCLWEIISINASHTFREKQILLEDNDTQWKKYVVLLHEGQPNIVSYDNVLECIIDFLVRNSHVFNIKAVDLTFIANSLCDFISKHKESVFQIDDIHIKNTKNIWID